MRRQQLTLLFTTTALPLAYSFQPREIQTKTEVLKKNLKEAAAFLPRYVEKGSAFWNQLLPFSAEDENKLNGSKVLRSLGLENNSAPRKLYVKPSQILNVASASLPLLLRVGSGIFGENYKVSLGPKNTTKYTIAAIGNFQIEETCSKANTQISDSGPILIYEFEACPFCRKVREAVSILSLEVEYRPCPRNGSIRREIKEKYGDGATFPFMVDPSTGVELFESDDIIMYLFKYYGIGNVPLLLGGDLFTTFTSGLGLLPRFSRGSERKFSNPPKLPLILWASESSPFCKLVREELCELEIIHRQISCPRGSVNRQKLFEKTGTFQAPYLEDPNNGVALFESYTIVKYFVLMYGVEPSTVRYL